MSHQTGSNGRLAKKKGLFFRFVKKWYHRCLSICLLLLFHTRGSSRVSEKRNQLFGTTYNLLTHFEWANANEEVFMCLLKEVSVIVARRMLFKRNTFRCQFPLCKKKGNEHRTMSATKFTSGGAQTKTFGELLCAPSSGGLHQRFTFFFQQCTFSSPWEHFLWILSSLLPFTRNLPSTRLLFSRTRRRQKKNFITKVLIGKLWFTIFPGQLLKGFQRKEENKYRMC